jgi:hypothetical protein
VIKTLSFWDTLRYNIFGWGGFTLPVGEEIKCFKDRRVVVNGSTTGPNWANNQTASSLLDPGKVGTDGVAQGTPMQLGGPGTRTVTWGSGYGRVNQWIATIPTPLLGTRYWITGYPVPMYDKRCIIMGPDGKVHELIQFDQDAPIRMAGLPQQALNRGMWSNGVLIDGEATTAAGLPSHAYLWGRGSSKNPHVQAMTVQDYLGGDGTAEFAAAYPDGPRCGDWYYLPIDSPSYKNMVAKGGECAARAKALNVHGVRLIDRGGRSSIETQAGTWARATNINQFTINLKDLRYAA